jgi:putative Holliday junction resolvase
MEEENKNVSGRLLALDLGSKFIGVAVSDELQISTRPLPVIQRTSWKKLLLSVSDLIQAFDAKALVIGLPLNMDGSESFSSLEAKRLARNFSRSLKIAIYLQDERLSSIEAKEMLSNEGKNLNEMDRLIDSKAATIILEDFLALENKEQFKVET